MDSVFCGYKSLCDWLITRSGKDARYVCVCVCGVCGVVFGVCVVWCVWCGVVFGVRVVWCLVCLWCGVCGVVWYGVWYVCVCGLET